MFKRFPKTRLDFFTGLFPSPTFCAVHNLQLTGGHPCRRCEEASRLQRIRAQVQFNDRTIAVAEDTIRVARRARMDALLELAKACENVITIKRGTCSSCGHDRVPCDGLLCAPCTIKEEIFIALERFVEAANSSETRHASLISVEDFGLSASALSRAEMLLEEIGNAL